MTRPFFSKDRITHFDIFDRYAHPLHHRILRFEPTSDCIMPRHAEHTLNKVAARLKEGVPVNWQDMVSRFTMDSATEFLFGKDVCSLDAPIPYPSTYQRATSMLADHSNAAAVHPADRFVRAFQAGQEATAMRSRFLQSWPLAEFWGDKVERQLDAVHRFIDPIVEDALRRKAERSVEGEDIEKDVLDDETLLEHLVKLTDGMGLD